MRCWKGNVEWAEETYGYCSDEHAEAMNTRSTCLLPEGHDGPHEFVPDDEIMLTFPDEGVAQLPEKQICKVCGCTDDNCAQCIEKTGRPCYWIEPDLCSACVVEQS